MKQNNELIHFLNSGVKCKTEIGILELSCIKISDEYKYWFNSYGEWDNKDFNYDILNKEGVSGISYSDFTPYLYPLSVLTETINHEGVDEIPLVELAKIEGTYKETYKEDNLFIDSKSIFWKSKMGSDFYFCHDKYINGFALYRNEKLIHLSNQLLLFQYFFSRRINVFAIEAIDPRTLGDKNPYLITNKK